jgi:hypothetical protein
MLFACSGGGSSNISALLGTEVTAPTVTQFTLPATAASLTVAVTSFTATDATGVTGYMITTSATAPNASAAGWTATAPTSFTFTAAGSQTAFAWAKNAAGNVSASKSATVTITTVAAAAVQGVAVNPQTGAPLAGATVNAYVQPSGLAKTLEAAVTMTATTDASGNFSITGLEAGTNYYFEFVMSGFAVFTYYNVVPTPTALVLETVRPIPVAWQTQTATVSGKVKNASTSAGLPNMTVKIRAGINNRTGSITATTTTDSTGAYSFANLAAGTYTGEVTCNIGTTAIITSYFTLVSFPGNTAANSNQDLPVTTPLSSTGPGQYRIVLNWGNDPNDLDSHLTGPTATTGTRFHTAYYADDYPAGSATNDPTNGFRIAGPGTEVVLDVDNTMHGTDNGPETTTIVVPRTGTYKFYVHHFSGSSTISASGAQVKVYKGSALLATFNPPASSLGDNAVWSVFTMDLTSSGETITPVNTISMIESTTLPKAANSGFEEYFLFSNLPRK